MKAARLKEIAQLLKIEEIEMAIDKEFDAKGLEYCVLVPNKSR